MEPTDKKRLAKITSLENLEKMLTVVSIRGWSLLLFFILLITSIIIWSVVGKIPITTSGESITLDPNNTFAIRSETSAFVKQILKIGGEKVQKGEILVILDSTELSTKINDTKNNILFLEKTGSENSEKLFLLKNSLKDLQKQAKELVIKSPADGLVVWVDLNVGDQVVPNDLLLTVQGNSSPDTIEIFAFIPLSSGQLVQPGMKTRCSLNIYRSEKYGLVRGTVQRVMPYPISADEYFMQKIPSSRLKEHLLGGDNILVVVKPDLDPNTYSGFNWTSKNSPHSKIEPLLLGTTQIILDEIKPISYIIPRFGN
ncbi:MAG: hypothetical protein COT85_04495 [Chlamydiae bacterium CG10_big_fil_rev_8_21_14_0_10_42_34]|nr:MAG: hypothetical protein COT85_04495 [Chlamydiae bacterium CG10_big_fil_rev_8_21_14_0_10_42_34]